MAFLLRLYSSCIVFSLIFPKSYKARKVNPTLFVVVPASASLRYRPLLKKSWRNPTSPLVFQFLYVITGGVVNTTSLARSEWKVARQSTITPQNPTPHLHVLSGKPTNTMSTTIAAPIAASCTARHSVLNAVCSARQWHYLSVGECTVIPSRGVSDMLILTLLGHI